eukprot:CAMPEP_0176166404 /NCGR_PEP_ID=MMETSP0120_2-20121206/85103_1 /TAXON_ID=160619 /ORGANISM="Kryptoperidinium foliaceum, Strain CCMP 1326" /LENGTH=175 /DNA_ID=CAMNT_0017503939 /DNA_START=103 /DNA_END=630 /DNA_ORIENTATION=-
MGCFTDGTCLHSARRDFVEAIAGLELCYSIADTGDEFCVQSISALHVYSLDSAGGGVSSSPLVTSCFAKWNGEACACEVCGVTNQVNSLNEPLVRADCSDVAGREAVYDPCAGSFTGALTFFNLDFNTQTNCPTASGNDGRSSSGGGEGGYSGPSAWKMVVAIWIGVSYLMALFF